jgi:pilus assembly protein Flp/PilA
LIASVLSNTPDRRHLHESFITLIALILTTSSQGSLGPEGSGTLIPGGTVKKIVAKFWADESGATAIEYGLIAAGISLAIIAAVNGLGSTLNTKFTSVNTSLK